MEDIGAADMPVDEKPMRELDAPVFFLSYARPRWPSHPALQKYKFDEPAVDLLADLTRHLSQLVPRPPGHDFGYMDLTMEGGELWEPELLYAIGTCSVLVALLSDPFFASAWCAMEWHAFSARTTVARSNGQPTRTTAILPVLWTPLTTPVPKMVNKVHRFRPKQVSAEVIAKYEADGLYGLDPLGERPIYDMLIWKLAVRIQRMHSALLTQHHVREDTTGLRRSFLEDSDG